MKKIPYTNTTGQRKTVGGMAVAPGATVFVAEWDHPEFKPATAERPRKTHTDPVLTLLDKPVAEIIPALPGLTDEQFDLLQQAERDGNKTRKSLIKAFDEEYIRRADAKVGGAGAGEGEGEGSGESGGAGQGSDETNEDETGEDQDESEREWATGHPTC